MRKERTKEQTKTSCPWPRHQTTVKQERKLPKANNNNLKNTESEKVYQITIQNIQKQEYKLLN